MSHNRRVDDNWSNVDVPVRSRRKCRRGTHHITARIRARANVIAETLQTGRLLHGAVLSRGRGWSPRGCLRRVRQPDSCYKYRGICSADHSGAHQRHPVGADSAVSWWRSTSFANHSIILALRRKPKAFGNYRVGPRPYPVRTGLFSFLIGLALCRTIARCSVLWIFIRLRRVYESYERDCAPVCPERFQQSVFGSVMQRVGACNHSAAGYALGNCGIRRRTQVG